MFLVSSVLINGKLRILTSSLVWHQCVFSEFCADQWEAKDFNFISVHCSDAVSEPTASPVIKLLQRCPVQVLVIAAATALTINQ